MNDAIKKALDEIAAAKPDTDSWIDAQSKVWLGEGVASQPLLLHCPLSPDEKQSFPAYSYKDIHYDSEKNMIFHIPAMLSSIRGAAGAIPSARANMGCGIYAAWFGLVQELYDDKMPWLLEHLGKHQLSEMKAGDLALTPEFETGLAHMRYMAEYFQGTGAQIFPMDLQGPVDLAHLVYGNDFFYDLYDDENFSSHLLDLCTHALIKGSNMCTENTIDSGKFIAHYNELVMPREIGGIKISEDTPTLLSADHIERFTMKYTNAVLSSSGGGYIHYCGKNEHLLKSVLSSADAHGLNFGNPEMHDMEEILRACAESDKIFYGKIPRNPSETWSDYFTRLLKASYKDGRFNLLLSMECDIAERDFVLVEWSRAQDTVRKQSPLS